MSAIIATDGVRLESRWDRPGAAAARFVVVLCHPHPLHGGTMDAPLMAAVTASLADAGAAVLRFNFRGVGSSEGSWGGGIDEIHDVAAAVEHAVQTHPGHPVGVSGWSFGAMTSLRWQARDRSTLPWAGIAPPLSLSTGGDLPDPGALPPARRLFLIGDRDQFTRADDLEEYARRAGAEFRLLAGSDHFFYFRERRVGALVAGHLGGDSPSSGFDAEQGGGVLDEHAPGQLRR